MQSSRVSKWQPSISTSLLHSGSQPSSFGPWLVTVTPRTVTWRENKGWICQKGGFTSLTPSIRTFVQP